MLTIFFISTLPPFLPKEGGDTFLNTVLAHQPHVTTVLWLQRNKNTMSCQHQIYCHSALDPWFVMATLLYQAVQSNYCLISILLPLYKEHLTCKSHCTIIFQFIFPIFDSTWHEDEFHTFNYISSCQIIAITEPCLWCNAEFQHVKPSRLSHLLFYVTNFRCQCFIPAFSVEKHPPSLLNIT